MPAASTWPAHGQHSVLSTTMRPASRILMINTCAMQIVPEMQSERTWVHSFTSGRLTTVMPACLTRAMVAACSFGGCITSELQPAGVA